MKFENIFIILFSNLYFKPKTITKNEVDQKNDDCAVRGRRICFL